MTTRNRRPRPSAGPTPIAAATTALVFSQVSAGGFENTGQHACGITGGGKAYCWGANGGGQLGNGTATGPEACLLFPGASDQTEACSTKPVAVAGGLTFRQVSVGGSHSCGVTTDRRAYCWGSNISGQLGDGSTTAQRLTPVAVGGGHRFRLVEAGFLHTCGVTFPDNLAYCWGLNVFGELGDRSTTTRRSPVAVAGGHTFSQVTTGQWFTCGVTPANVAYCWGRNRSGQVGDSTNAGRRQQPVLVAGGHRFTQVAAGARHACAVTLANQAYCWGDGQSGQLGDGKRNLSFWPRAVSGGLSLERVTAGGSHTCGETTGNLAYCWGFNAFGEVGDGTFGAHVVPAAVGGGRFFSQLSAGSELTCGRTPAAPPTAGAGTTWGRSATARRRIARCRRRSPDRERDGIARRAGVIEAAIEGSGLRRHTPAARLTWSARHGLLRRCARRPERAGRGPSGHPPQLEHAAQLVRQVAHVGRAGGRVGAESGRVLLELLEGGLGELAGGGIVGRLGGSSRRLAGPERQRGHAGGGAAQHVAPEE